MTKTPNEALLDQPAGIRSLIADLTHDSTGFHLTRCGSLSAIADTQIGLAHGPHAFHTLSIALGDSPEKTLADRIPATVEGLKPLVDQRFRNMWLLVDFLVDAQKHNDPSCVTHVAGILVGHSFTITAIHRHSLMTTMILRLGEPLTGIRAELTWLA